MIRNTSILFLGIIFGVLLTEGILRANYSRLKNYNTEMWRYANELKLLVPDSGIGHIHKSNAAANLYDVKIETNNLGFRGPLDFNPTDTSRRKILIIGDSIGMGWGVPYQDSFAGLIQKKYTGSFDVWNTSVGNYSIHNQIGVLKKWEGVKCDLVIQLYYINDAEVIEYPNRVSHFFQSNFLLYSFLADSLIKILHSDKGNYRKFYKETYLSKNIFFESFNGILSWSEVRKIPHLFINIPEMHQFKQYPFPKIHNLIEKGVQHYPHITYLDLLPMLRDHNPEGLWVSKEDQHPNIKANKLFLDSARPYLEKLLNHEKRN